MTDDEQRDQPLRPEDPPLNREERRRRRFHPKAAPYADRGSAGAPPAGPAPATAETQPGDSGPTRLTGAGAGGAIEPDGRLIHHEGAHLGNQPNS